MTDAAATDILLVEDNPGDVILFSEAVEAAKMTANVHVVGDGLAAIPAICKRQAKPGTNSCNI